MSVSVEIGSVKHSSVELIQLGTPIFANVCQYNFNVWNKNARQGLSGTRLPVTASQIKSASVLNARLINFLTKLLAHAKQDHSADLNAVLNQWFGKQANVNVCREK